jgi:hypothetical protein
VLTNPPFGKKSSVQANPDVIAREIAEDLRAALEQFEALAEERRK